MSRRGFSSSFLRMLPVENRLTHRNDFARVMQKGKYGTDRILTLKIVRNNLPQSRFGFVVSTKVSKRAVVRNGIRRRLREIIRLALPTLVGGYDVAVLASQAAAKLKTPELRQSLNGLIQRAGLAKRV